MSSLTLLFTQCVIVSAATNACVLQEGLTAVMVASQCGQLSVVTNLIESRAQVDLRDFVSTISIAFQSYYLSEDTLVLCKTTASTVVSVSGK